MIYLGGYINSIYFDDLCFSSYYENVNGDRDREKYRIRWYGDIVGNIVEPCLEKKTKIGQVGRKFKYKLNKISLSDSTYVKDLIVLIDKSKLPKAEEVKISGLTPLTLVRYSRQYFESKIYPFRITVDKDLEFFYINKNNPMKFSGSIKLNDTIIIEFKFPTNFLSNAHELINPFGIRISKSSKYVSSIDYLYKSIFS